MLPDELDSAASRVRREMGGDEVDSVIVAASV